MAKGKIPAPSTKRSRPALSPEARENQMIAYAMDLVERRLIEGTASSQETTHFLKLARKKAQAELEILEMQKELISAKTQALQSQAKSEELFARAISAMKRYSGNGDEPEDD